MESNGSFHGEDGEAAAADALLLPKVSSKELLHRPAKHTGEQAVGLQLPVTTKDVAIAADAESTPPTVLEQAAAAMFYAIASLMVIFVNKVKRVGFWLMILFVVGCGLGIAPALGLLLGVGVRRRAGVSWVS